jgi:hypothetical protein
METIPQLDAGLGSSMSDVALRATLPMCRLLHIHGGHIDVATNLALDSDLLERAYRVSGAATKKAAVTRALEEFIARHEQRHITELFGTLEWDDTFDYKTERDRKQ